MCDDETHEHEAVCSQHIEAKYKRCTLPVQLTCPREQKHVYVAKCCDRDTQPCPIRCGAALKCGHQCTGACGSCAETSRHKPCAARCKEILPCQHQCRVSASHVHLTFSLLSPSKLKAIEHLSLSISVSCCSLYLLTAVG